MKTVVVSIEMRVADDAACMSVTSAVLKKLMVRDLPGAEDDVNCEIIGIKTNEKYRVKHAEHCAVADNEPCTCGADEANQ